VLQTNGVQEGAIFRRIRKGGHLGEPLAPAAVRDIVKERCALAGIEGRFSAHSLRAGFVTEAGKQNMPLPDHGQDRAPERGDGRGVFPSGECVEQQSQQDA
jgi:hypothetical protein